jgi:hypothetical protein
MARSHRVWAARAARRLLVTLTLHGVHGRLPGSDELAVAGLIAAVGAAALTPRR